jgi:hypothetical protein
MTNAKVKIFKKNGELLGYFQDPEIKAFAQGEYEICGQFLLSDGKPAQKLDFNPQALPYTADLCDLPNAADKTLSLVYVQHARQPISFWGAANTTAKIY